MKTQIEVTVEKATYDFGQGLRRFVGEARGALKNGFQPGTAIPALLQAAFADLFPLLEGINQVKADSTDDKKAFRRALEECVEDLVDDFMGDA